MKIYKDLNIMVVKHKKLELFKGYRLLLMLAILLSVAFTALLIIKHFNLIYY
tara:strand:- start:474 stop:629 length:156 start_codon:yes stop_codon:yes gene_type:complete